MTIENKRNTDWGKIIVVLVIAALVYTGLKSIWKAQDKECIDTYMDDGMSYREAKARCEDMERLP